MKTYTFLYCDDDTAILSTFNVDACSYNDAVDTMLTVHPNIYYYEERSDD